LPSPISAVVDVGAGKGDRDLASLSADFLYKKPEWIFFGKPATSLIGSSVNGVNMWDVLAMSNVRMSDPDNIMMLRITYMALIQLVCIQKCFYL
jgi:hypothetical protein